ncbi:hypothetical protein ACFW5I_33100 [Streptomyces sp. NPDC058818]|uniref:hypothetical protein n=1 Tax=Streptomyces sp. NPDC058818 TaxID=3346640 RepID=UPI0036B3374B
MMYSFMMSGSELLGLLPGVMAEAFDVRLDETDVSASSELEDRNWDAVVTCEYDVLSGDLSWALSVFAADEVEVRPSVEGFALYLARRLEVPVFFEWSSEVPWIRRVALPSGRITVARVVQSGEKGNGFSVEAAESSIPGFPDVVVTHLPEVARAFTIAAPITDSISMRGAGGDFERMGQLLGNWERLCVRLRSNWPPNGWYSAAMYGEDLRLRDELQALLGKMGGTEKGELEAVLRELDENYRALTIDDSGAALAEALKGDIANLADRPWYWNRRPEVLPWL